MADKPDKPAAPVKLNPIQDFFIFLGILFLMFVVWVSTGGPERYISRAGPFLNPPAPLGSGTAYDLGEESYTTSSGDGTILSNSNVVYTGPTPGVGAPSQGEAKPLSPESEFLQITLPAGSTGLSLSNLYIEDNTGVRIRVPNGATLTSLGTTPAERPIVLAPGEKAYVISGRSPVGVSFRLNRCSGYLSQYQKFIPSLPLECPLAVEEIVSPPQCSLYTRTLSRCTTPTDTALIERYTGNPDCGRIALTKLTYSGCVDTHRYEAGFERPEWRIYLGSTKRLWDKSKTIRLTDGKGLTILTFTKGN
ncbi:MAG: hypothetical protein V4674_04450 [Patescibacteria group bacterium]